MLACDSTWRRPRSLKQENRMKTLSKWLMATSLTILAFFVLMMLITSVFESNSVGMIPACRGWHALELVGTEART